MLTTLIVLVLASALQTAPPPRLLDKGDQSSMDDARQAVARTAAEWNALWRAHAPDRPRPQVDFPREMAVAVFLGSRPTAGYAVEIVGTREESGALVVQYRETQPARGFIAAQVITSAYHIVALPGRTGEVRFERLD